MDVTLTETILTWSNATIKSFNNSLKKKKSMGMCGAYLDASLDSHDGEQIIHFFIL